MGIEGIDYVKVEQCEIHIDGSAECKLTVEGNVDYNNIERKLGNGIQSIDEVYVKKYRMSKKETIS